MQISQTHLQLNKPDSGPAVLDTMLRLMTKFDKKGNTTAATELILNNHNNDGGKKNIQRFLVQYDNLYDTQGRLRQCDVYQDTISHYTITYNDEEDVQEDKLLSVGYKIVYKHAPGNCLEQAIYLSPRGDTTFTIRYTYNQRGNLIKAQSFKHGTDLDTSTYYLYKTYDAKGNWTKRIAQTDYKNGTSSPGSIQERAYVYYK